MLNKDKSTNIKLDNKVSKMSSSKLGLPKTKRKDKFNSTLRKLIIWNFRDSKSALFCLVMKETWTVKYAFRLLIRQIASR